MGSWRVAVTVLFCALVVALLVVAVCDAVRGPRSWRDWWRSLR